MKGDMRMLEVMPSDALAAGATIVGTGATPEGIDQNPACERSAVLCPPLATGLITPAAGRL